jgi:hypothetical protein
MGQTIVISSNNFSGEQANIIFTPSNSSESYGLGIQTLPYTFDTSIIDNNLNATGTYSIKLINSSCSYILVVN